MTVILSSRLLVNAQQGRHCSSNQHRRLPGACERVGRCLPRPAPQRRIAPRRPLVPAQPSRAVVLHDWAQRHRSRRLSFQRRSRPQASQRPNVYSKIARLFRRKDAGPSRRIRHTHNSVTISLPQSTSRLLKKRRKASSNRPVTSRSVRFGRVFLFGAQVQSVYHRPVILDPSKCRLLVLLLREPSFCSARLQFRRAGKTKMGKLVLFSDFYKHLSGPHVLALPDSLAPSPSCYSAASAPIRRTMLPNNRRVRWLSAYFRRTGRREVSVHAYTAHAPERSGGP